LTGHRIEVVGAAIFGPKGCLVAQRGEGGSAAFCWEFPGGKVEPGESQQAALRREICEELAVAVRVEEKLGMGTAAGSRGLIELHVYACQLISQELDIELRDHIAMKWIGAGELDTLTWARADLPILPAVAEKLKLR